MATTAFSLGDYQSLLTKKLRSLRHFERCLFAAWCAHYLLNSQEDQLGREISEPDSKRLQQILDGIWLHLLNGSIPSRNTLNDLDEQLLEIGSDDPVAAIESHPIRTAVQSAVGLCILGCRRNDVSLAQGVGDTVISVLDYDLDQRDPDYSGLLDRIFEHAEMKRERETQLAMVRHLQGEYDLDERLRTAFR
jgi:hypothetical protein